VRILRRAHIDALGVASDTPWRGLSGGDVGLEATHRRQDLASLAAEQAVEDVTPSGHQTLAGPLGSDLDVGVGG
jgi:hypothetical protein